MRYGDLIQFEPIESVIQLLDANRPDEAKKLVATYVMSDDMAERIAKQMIPQLSFDASVDHMGVLVVGNYGTGKSHLMSVLSLVAEDAAYQSMIRHPKVAEAAGIQAVSAWLRTRTARSCRNTTTTTERPMIENLKVRFVRKPQDLDEVLASINGEWANRIEIQACKALTEVEYDEFARTPLADREWLAGLGGYLESSGRRVVEVTAPNRTTLYVDPSGSTYGRYVGLRVDLGPRP